MLQLIASGTLIKYGHMRNDTEPPKRDISTIREYCMNAIIEMPHWLGMERYVSAVEFHKENSYVSIMSTTMVQHIDVI